MQLFQLWQDSLKIFIPRNFKLFGLVSLNTALQTYKVWLGRFWALFVAFFFIDFFLSRSKGLALPNVPFALLTQFLLLVTLYLSVRPSVARKTYTYFIGYGSRFLLYTLILLPFFSLFLAIDLFLPMKAVPLTFFMLFFLDSRGSLNDFFGSFIRAVKMIVYGLPFFLILFLASFALYSIVSIALAFGLPPQFRFLTKHFLLLLSVVPVSFAANFYTKKVHENYTLYFD